MEENYYKLEVQKAGGAAETRQKVPQPTQRLL